MKYHPHVRKFVPHPPVRHSAPLLRRLRIYARWARLVIVTAQD